MAADEVRYLVEAGKTYRWEGGRLWEEYSETSPSADGKTVGWRHGWRTVPELAAEEESMMTASERYAALATVLSDLDRCMHGRHRADSCFGCPDGRSAGNHHLPPAGGVVGYDYAGRPYVVPAVGRSFSEPDAWRP